MDNDILPNSTHLTKLRCYFRLSIKTNELGCFGLKKENENRIQNKRERCNEYNVGYLHKTYAKKTIENQLGERHL